jgi:hypothetical protein
VGVISVGVRDQSILHGLPRVDIKIARFAVQALFFDPNQISHILVYHTQNGFGTSIRFGLRFNILFVLLVLYQKKVEGK